MEGRIFSGQCQRVFGSFVFWLCVVIFAALLVFNSTMTLFYGGDVLYAFDFATLNLEALALSILPSLPFALSYYEEKRERSLRFSYIRSGTAEYITAKYLTVIFSGFLVVFLGFLLFTAVMSAFVPLYGELSQGDEIGLKLLISRGRYLEYIFLFSLCYGMSGALFSGITFLCSFFIRGSYTVMVMPYIGYRMMLFLKAVLKIPVEPRSWFIDFPMALTPAGTVLKKLVFVSVILLVIGFTAVWKAERSALRD